MFLLLQNGTGNLLLQNGDDLLLQANPVVSISLLDSIALHSPLLRALIG